MDSHDVMDALSHLASSLHLDTFAGAAVAGGLIAAGVYYVRRWQLATNRAQERPSPVRTKEIGNTETLFVMPDVSGYTKLLSTSGRDRAGYANEAVIELLDALIESVNGRLKVAKLEGDAILFFAESKSISPNDLGDTLLDLFRAFDKTKHRLALDDVLPSALLQLDLKVVVHCGHAERLKFRNAIDLVGADVVLTYRLLKTGLRQSRYLLSTDAAFDRFVLPRNHTIQHINERIPEFGDTALVVVDIPYEGADPDEQTNATRKANRYRPFQPNRALTAL